MRKTALVRGAAALAAVLLCVSAATATEATETTVELSPVLEVPEAACR